MHAYYLPEKSTAHTHTHTRYHHSHLYNVQNIHYHQCNNAVGSAQKI